MIRELKAKRRLATTLTLLSLALLAAIHLARGASHAEASGAPGPLAALAGQAGLAGRNGALPRLPLPPLDLTRIRADADGFVQVMPDGGRLELTVDPRLERKAAHALEQSGARYGAAVLVGIDGRVLAVSGYGRPGRGPADGAGAGAAPSWAPATPEALGSLDLALRPWAPAASIFKVVTAAALVGEGVGGDARVCYHDGIHSVEASNLIAQPRWDHSCNSLAFGVAKSQNAIIARLAHEHLSADALGRTARALGFGAPIPFDLPVEPSTIELPEAGSLAFARTAAGFWRTTLSPMHGALIAATLARGGVAPRLRLVERAVDARGEELPLEEAPEARVLPEAVAREVGRMMVGTTEYGTARLGFHERSTGRPILPGIAVAGKTGTLNRTTPCASPGPTCDAPFLGYSWFVGFAPAERPEVAVSVLLGNGEAARKRAHQVAAELLAGYFHGGEGDAPLPETRIASR